MYAYEPVTEEEAPRMPVAPEPPCRKISCVQVRRWCAVSGCVVGIICLALGIYYQTAVCAKYPDWVNVQCNTTSFRMTQRPFVGIAGYVTADYLNGTCHSPEFQVFECDDLQNLPSCVAAGRLNFDTHGALWPCYQPIAVCDPWNIIPVVAPPKKVDLIGCILPFPLILVAIILLLCCPGVYMTSEEDCFEY